MILFDELFNGALHSGQFLSSEPKWLFEHLFTLRYVPKVLKLNKL